MSDENGIPAESNEEAEVKEVSPEEALNLLIGAVEVLHARLSAVEEFLTEATKPNLVVIGDTNEEASGA